MFNMKKNKNCKKKRVQLTDSRITVISISAGIVLYQLVFRLVLHIVLSYTLGIIQIQIDAA